MKKILFFLAVFISLKTFAQHPIGNDSFQLQTLGNANTLVKSKAAIGSDSGFVNARYADTAAANRGKIKNYPGALIRVNDTLWLRNSTATGWITISGGGGSTNSNIGSGYRWAIPNTNNIKTAFGDFAITIDSITNANALTYKLDTSTTGIHTENYYNTKYLYTASNGITLGSNNFKWGGTLVNNTTITGGGFYSAFNGGRLEAGQGAAVAAANDLALGADGNTFSITGATQINAITTANWQAGSTISLVFASNPVVKNNTAGGAGTAKILLSNGADYTAAANDVLTLLYDGTVWHETARKIAGTSPAWLLASGGTLTGSNTITSNTANQLNFGGTYTTTANSQFYAQFNPSITARATTSDEIVGLKIAPTIIDAANSQQKIAIDIAPAYTSGGFGSVIKTAIRHTGRIVPSVTNVEDLGASTLLYQRVLATNGFFTYVEAGASSTLTFRDGSAGNSVGKIVGNGGGTLSPFLQIGGTAVLGATNNYMLDIKGPASIYGTQVIRQLATPGITSAVVGGTAGTTSMTYKVVCRDASGSTTDASTTVNTTTANATLTGSNTVTVAFPQVTGAVFYDVYLTATTGAATLGKIGTYTSGAFFNGSVVHSANAQGDGTTAPTTNTTGSIVVGGTTSLAALTIRAGTASPGGAPIVLQSGTNLTTTEAGTVEYDGTHLYFTAANAGTRYQLDQQTGSGGTVTSVSGTANRITSTGGTTPVIDIDAAYVGQTSITTLGTIGAGTWQGGVISSTYGGTGVNNGGRTLTLNTNSGTLAYSAASKTLTIAKSLTLDGTDATTMTFPSTSATIARTDAAQTFTGVQTFSSAPVISSITNTGTITLPTVTGTAAQFFEAAITSSATPAPAGDARENWLDITALSATATVSAPSGTPLNHNALYIRIKDDGTARSLNWNAIYRASTDLPLPTTTTLSKTSYMKFIYNSADSKWDLTAYLNNF